MEEPAPAKKPRKAKPYVPSLRSGPYALILALSSLPEDSLQSLSKSQLIGLAQPHCESSFSVPNEAGKFYTAWNSMNTLVDKDLVQERGRPLRKYSLTDEGWEVARRIKAVQGGESGGKVTKGKDIGEDLRDFGNRMAETKSRESADRFVDLEDASDDLGGFDADLERVIALSKATAAKENPGDTRPGPSGQRLGGAPIDKFGTFNKSREREAPPPPKGNIVELISSPEPEATPNIPWASSSFDQDSRPFISKQPTKAHGKVPETSSYTSYLHQPPKTQLSTTHPPLQTTETPLPTFTPIVLLPGTFTVRLVLDNREVRTRDDRDYIGDQLRLLGCNPLVRPLELGDFFWVAKLHDPNLLSRHGEEGDEVALDWIVERKRLDDLVGK